MENPFYIYLLKWSKYGVSKRFYTTTLLAKCKMSYFENFRLLLYINFYVNGVISLFLVSMTQENIFLIRMRKV